VIPSLYRRGEVLETEDGPNGTFVVARVSRADLHAVEEFVAEPTEKRSRA